MNEKIIKEELRAKFFNDEDEDCLGTNFDIFQGQLEEYVCQKVSETEQKSVKEIVSKIISMKYEEQEIEMAESGLAKIRSDFNDVVDLIIKNLPQSL